MALAPAAPAVRDDRPLPGAEMRQPGALHQTWDVLKRKHLAPRGPQQLSHILAPHAEATPRYTGNHLKTGRVFWTKPLGRKRAEMLHTRDLVACCAVVFGNLRLNDYVRIKLIRHNKIRRLIKTSQSLRSFC